EWGGGFVLSEQHQHCVRSVEARGGLVLAGGANLYMIRPGATTIGMCPPPEELGPVHVVAVEPRGARRYATACGEVFAVFVGLGKDEQILQIDSQITRPGSRFTHLAWGGATGPCALWARRDDGRLFRIKPDISGALAVPVGPVDALASDDAGGIALVSLVEGAQRVFVTRDGREMNYRSIEPEIRPGASVEIAVAGMAAALVVDRRYVLLSRRPDEPFARVQALELVEDPPFTLGPIAFQGTSSDAALFCAQRESTGTRVVRVAASGEAMSTFVMFQRDDSAPPEVGALSWDATRQTLWGVGPDAGLFMSTAPGAKGRRFSLS
ncbi:MAG TPA: hypothetical protein VIF09_25550, partial [Polyangiaceae bacterium]